MCVAYKYCRRNTTHTQYVLLRAQKKGRETNTHCFAHHLSTLKRTNARTNTNELLDDDAPRNNNNNDDDDDEARPSFGVDGPHGPSLLLSSKPRTGLLIAAHACAVAVARTPQSSSV